MPSTDQSIVFALLAVLFVLLVWGRWRYDVVAFGILLAAVLLKVVPAGEAFSGFGHPATVTVAAILILSRALSRAGATDIATQLIRPALGSTPLHIAALSALGAVLSSFMNNVGTLGLLMPVAIQSALKAKRSATLLLMPLSFGSILGGLITMIGTPPNIIIATYRGDALGEPFGMFDFTPVGAVTALAGVIFIALIGWRLVPLHGQTRSAAEELFDIESYVTELRVPADSPHLGKSFAELEKMTAEIDVLLVDLIRRERRYAGPMVRHLLEAGDILKIEGGPEEIDRYKSKLGLELARAQSRRAEAEITEDPTLIEAVVGPGSRLEGREVGRLRFFANRGIALLAVSRKGRPTHGRLQTFQIEAGDVLLLHGEAERLPDAVTDAGCLPLAQRAINYGRRHQAPLLIGIFAAAIAVSTLGMMPITIALGLAVALIVVLGYLPARELYDGIDWPVIVLLGALIPVGGALQTTGGTALIAQGILLLTQGLPAAAVLVILMVVTMSLSDVLNNAATAVVMAPIGLSVAASLGVSPDPFLMAIAVSASCAFLTPIGHQNNALIMGPGGYRFGDYWRMGLPLEVLVIAVSIPMILWVWPL